jgi:hypothetical protein
MESDKKRAKRILFVAAMLMEMEMSAYVLPSVFDGCVACLRLFLIPPAIMIFLWVLAWLVYFRNSKIETKKP